ncbi:MAG: hypothetical protein CAK90_00510 [Spartobacteria bacterium AMD-G4]|nr:MAG: hypothetical protein CAK90_00510 [Spartobacteria bacterium AMD-G4]
MTKPVFHGVLTALSLALLLVGCESVSYTAQFYRPSTARVFPPKPKDYSVPIFSKPPDRPYTVIGRLSFTANASYDFMIRAIHYNTRLQGGDAAIMLHEDIEQRPYNYYVPGYTSYVPVTTYSFGTTNSRYCGPGGPTRRSEYGTSTSTTYLPAFNPGYMGVGMLTLRSIDASIIRYK